MNEINHWKAAKNLAVRILQILQFKSTRTLFFFFEGREAVPGTLTRFYDGDKTAAQSGLGLISASQLLAIIHH